MTREVLEGWLIVPSLETILCSLNSTQEERNPND